MPSRKGLTLSLPDSDRPLHERLAEALERAIAAGQFKPGERLPTHRDLSRQADVAIGTVTRAIESLSRRGIVRGEIGRGTFVQGTGAKSIAPHAVDLTINAPPPVIGEATMAAILERAGRRAAALPNGGYVDLTGTPEQRSVMADWLGRTRLDADAQDILLCVGAQQGLHLAFADLRRQSPSIATEAATFAGAISAAANLGMELLPVRHDRNGMLPGDLDRVLAGSGCRIVYTTPVCQNPLGFETGPERRAEILDVCGRHGAFIIEDDVYGLYARKGRATYKSMAPDRVFFVTSLSKCSTPLFRAGLIVPPRDRRPSIERRMRAEIWGAPPLALAVGCAMIELGVDVAAAEALRAEARVRTGLAADILGMGDLPMPEGAPHIWLPMRSIEAERLARRAMEHGIRVTPPDATSIDDAGPGGVRLCIMAPPRRDDLARALRTVARLLERSDEAVV